LAGFAGIIREMAIPLSVSMLRRKRDQIRDSIAAHELRLREAQADLAHVLATLRLTDTKSCAERTTSFAELQLRSAAMRG
jgi:hypothetical protein